MSLILQQTPHEACGDGSAFRSAKGTRTTVTYPEIKAYVKDKFGLNVTSLNIAQVKEKHGLEKRKNYYNGKDGHRVPNCPPEKEKAIADAFEYFGML